MAETSLTSGHEPSINSRRNWRSVYIKCGADNVTVAGATRASSDKQRANRTGGNLATRDRFYRYRLYFLFLFLLLSLSSHPCLLASPLFFLKSTLPSLSVRRLCRDLSRGSAGCRAISSRNKRTRRTYARTVRLRLSFTERAIKFASRDFIAGSMIL